jgi:hypothetical protein
MQGVAVVNLGLGFSHSSRHQNFVEQLYQSEQIPHPIITARGRSPPFIGYIDEHNCANWTHFATNVRPEGGWAIEVDRLDLFGVPFFHQQVSSYFLTIRLPYCFRLHLI